MHANPREIGATGGEFRNRLPAKEIKNSSRDILGSRLPKHLALPTVAVAGLVGRSSRLRCRLREILRVVLEKASSETVERATDSIAASSLLTRLSIGSPFPRFREGFHCHHIFDQRPRQYSFSEGLFYYLK